MSLTQLIGGLGSVAAGYELADDIRGVGADAAAQMGGLASQLQEDTGFRGYGVQTGFGTGSVDAAGNTTIGTGPDAGMLGAQQQYMNASQQAAANAMMSPYDREQEIYNRAMAMQNPMLDAQQAQQQAREYAMGRGGVRGSQFGGTAEDAAMARARAQASNQAAFSAMGQAQQEMLNQGVLANQFGQLGYGAQAASFLPFQQQLAAMQLGGQNADRFQSGQFTGANLAGQLGLGSMQAQINAEKAASELYGNLFGAGMNALGNMQGGLTGMLQGIGSDIGGAIDTVSGWFD